MYITHPLPCDAITLNAIGCEWRPTAFFYLFFLLHFQRFAARLAGAIQSHTMHLWQSHNLIRILQHRTREQGPNPDLRA